MEFKLLITSPKRLLFALFYKIYLGKFGWKSIVIKPLRINGHKRIFIGNSVIVNYKSWLAATSETGHTRSQLIIEDGCKIGSFNHIYATKEVILRKNVLTADKVYISDNLHSYEDINTPVVFQPVKQIGIVEIGEGSWIGENACIIGAKIGKHCVIGANSVVTKDIPDYCVVVGAPAKIIKRYDFNTCTWQRIELSKADEMGRGGGKIDYFVLAA